MNKFGPPCGVLGCGRSRRPDAIMCGSCWRKVPTACKLALDDHDRRLAHAMRAERMVENFERGNPPMNADGWRQEAELRPFIAWSWAETVMAAQRLAFESAGE